MKISQRLTLKETLLPLGVGNCIVSVSTTSFNLITKIINVSVKNSISINNTNNPNTPENTSSNITYINGILLVNKTYHLPSTYSPGVNSEALNQFNLMKTNALSEGINLKIVSGFRSYSSQKSIFNKNKNLYGEAEANTFSAKPGESEHQTGLAFDINYLQQSFGETLEGKWLAENCHKYGFIIRYLSGKENITGYMYEPWHIRYVGTEHATNIYNSGLCLEEYLGIS